MVLQIPEMAMLDLDGTLVDSVPDMAYSLQQTLARIGLPGQGEDKIRDWVGNGIEYLVKRAVREGLDDEPEQALVDEAFSIFLAIYGENTCTRSRCYPGVQEGMDYLKSKQIKLGCVTNKRAQFTESILRKLGLFDDFGIVIGGDTLPKRKPDPLPLLHAAAHFNVAAENALMIGDSSKDIEAGRAACFKVVCVTYGYNFGRDIRASKPDAVVDSLAELPALFQEI